MIQLNTMCTFPFCFLSFASFDLLNFHIISSFHSSHSPNTFQVHCQNEELAWSVYIRILFFKVLFTA